MRPPVPPEDDVGDGDYADCTFTFSSTCDGEDEDGEGGSGGGEDGCDHDGDSLDDHLYENIFK